MGLEAVKEEIIRNAKEQESALLAEARKEALRVMKEAESKIDETKQKSEAATKKSMEAAKKQALASAEMESKKILLEMKKQIIEKAFDEVKKSLESADEKKREAYIKSLFEKAKKELDVAYVYCNRKDTKFLKNVKTGEIDILGGIITENHERTIRVDYNFETLLEFIKDSEMQSISKILFG